MLATVTVGHCLNSLSIIINGIILHLPEILLYSSVELMEDLVCSKLSIKVSKPFDTNLRAVSSHINLSFLLFQPDAIYSARHRKLNYSLQQGLKLWTSHHYETLKSSIFSVSITLSV